MSRSHPPRPVRGGSRFAALLASAVVVTAAITAAAPLPGPARPPRPPETDSHEDAEGVRLVALRGETAARGGRCGSGAPAREYSIVSLAVEITLNRYLDHDPDGRMYALADAVDAVRREEAANAAARRGPGAAAVSLGLQGDAIQPLVLRARPGECVRIELRNDLAEPASLHLHGAGLRVAGGGAAIATNPRATAAAGETVRYEWAIPRDEPEATHYFHSHAAPRTQTHHGLFGALIVEPARATWTDPRTGAEANGWDAVVAAPGRKAFREFVLFYHEVGDEAFQIRDRAGGLVPLVDPLLSAYRPGSRALNYRSEPFLNRMRLQQSLTGRFDESLAYSSYAFGDPATPVLRSYVGDPVKQRVVHGGSEVAHVHHVHGGSVRWPRRRGADPPLYDAGPTKHPPLRTKSERTDSQSIGPSETFDTENECGAGGCQASVGDFLVHCHVAHHYFAGMWGIWRVYNTLQSFGAQTDVLPPLPALPDRKDAVAAAVTSRALTGRTVSIRGGSAAVSDPVAWAAALLPPAGARGSGDASSLDWRASGGLVSGEVEDARVWPGYRSPAPGARLPILFDPRSGRPAYPFLRPHLGVRPPFAPNHGPSPHLDPPVPGGPAPPAPGASGPESICPAGTRQREFQVNAIQVPVALNRRAGLVDPDGQIYVLSEDEPAVRADPARRTPLVIRANAAEDCVDVVFATSLPDGPVNHGFAKANMHIHFVQFDVQASDGVVTGFNYEQSVRPYTTEGARLAAAAPAGRSAVQVIGGGRFRPGMVVAIGLGTPRSFEARRVVRVQRDVLVLDRPLAKPHGNGEIVSTEFVRYRWYPDAQTGTAYFHDHVNALQSWRHGLFGALVVEPPGSTYHDPSTGAEIRSGALADVHTPSPFSDQVPGPFREAVLILQDDVPITSTGRALGGAINMRAEPLEHRGRDPASVFRGDPETPLVRAHLGDPVVFRTLVGGTNDVHTFHLDGHSFRAEPNDPRSPPVSTVRLGISERFDIAVPEAGGPRHMPGDYLYSNGRRSKLLEGSWGLLRVFGPGEGEDLRRLPGRAAVRPGRNLCPPDAPVRGFDVAAIASEGAGSGGRVFVAASGRRVARAAEPLVLRARSGDCLRVRLRNRTDTPVSFHADLLAYDPASSGGVAAGRHAAQAVAPGGTRTYEFFAPAELGQTAATIRDLADPANGARRGLYGAIVLSAPGSRLTDPRSGAEIGDGWLADVTDPAGSARRDAVLFLHDEDAGIGTHQMPYSVRVKGTATINYRSAGPDAGAHASVAPTIDSYAGDAITLHVLAPVSEQVQVFTLEEQAWDQEPRSSTLLGGLDVIEARLRRTAGGAALLPGDYAYGNHREPYRQAGMRGTLRVRDVCSSPPAPRRLSGRSLATACQSRSLGLMLAALLAGGAGLVVTLGRRRQAPGTNPR